MRTKYIKGHNAKLSDLKGEWAFLQHKDGGTILSGYRVGLGFKGNCKSLLRMHNETMNIWSHLLGALFFVYLTADLQHQISVPLLRDSLYDIVYAGQPFVHGKDMSFQNTSDMRAYMRRLYAEIDLVDSSWWINATSNVHTTCISMMEYGNPLLTIVGKVQTQHTLANMEDQVVKPLRNEFYNTTTGLIAACYSLSKQLFVKANAQESASHLTNKLQNASNYIRDMGDRLQKQLSLALAEQVEKMLPAAPLDATTDSKFIQVLQALATRIHQRLGAIGVDFKKDTTDLQIASQFIDLPFWPTFIFLASAIVCMSFSALFHLLNPISASAYKTFQKLDYAGISILIAGSTVPIIYYSFRCSGTLKSVFLFFDIGLNLACMVVIMLPCSRKHSPAMQAFRAVCYVVSGLASSVPIFYLLFQEDAALHDEYGMSRWPWVRHMLQMGACYIFGAFLYARRIPERFFVGSFDIWFSSHQLFHCLVFAGAYFHYFAVQRNYQWSMFLECS